MRILRAKVQNYRIHGETEVTFQPDLTVIHGPNESGKSTLVEALHRSLFLSPKVGGQVRNEMLRQPSGGHPEVEVEFLAEGKRWVLWKRFGGGSAGEATLKDPDGRVLSGTEAEDRLARLVGTDPVTTGGGATKALQERWGHLWVWQGSAGEDLLSRDSGPDTYDHGKLVARLQEVGEVSVQSVLDQEVVAGVNVRWSQVHTATGQVKTASALNTARKQRDGARDARDKTLQGLEIREDAQRRYLKASRRVEEAQEELPRVEVQLRELDTRLSQAQELQGQLEHESELLKPKQEELQRLTVDADDLQSARATLAKLSEALGPGHQALADLKRRHEEALVQRTKLREERQAQEKALEELREEVQTAENRSNQVRLTLEVNKLERVAEAQEKLRLDLGALEERMGSLPSMSPKDVQGLHDLTRTWELAQAELRNLAAGVRAVRAGVRVEVDGEELPEGEVRQITNPARLTVGDSVVLEVIPGGGSSAEEVRVGVIEAQARLARELERLGVKNVAEAEDVLRQRQILAQERAELVAGSNRGRLEEPGEDAARQLAEARETLRYLEKDAHLEALGAVDAAEVAHVTGEEEEVRARMGIVNGELSRIQISLDAAQGILDQLGVQIQEASEALKSQESRKALTENRVQLILKRHQSGDALQEALKTVRQEVEARTGRIKEKEAALAGLDVSALEAGLRDAESRLAGLEWAREEARDECLRLEGALKAGAGTDLDGSLEQQEAALESLRAEVVRLEREAAMLQLLKDLLEDEQNLLATQFSAPLQRAMEAYLACLLPEGSAPTLQYDAAQGFHALRWRRGEGVAWDFKVLSGGAKEQLMAALRLAMAEVLAGVGEGAATGDDRPGLPVVFDDSFVNADPQRMKGINRMLRRAADRGLQVLVFTCDPAGLEAMGEERRVALAGGG